MSYQDVNNLAMKQRKMSPTMIRTLLLSLEEERKSLYVECAADQIYDQCVIKSLILARQKTTGRQFF